MQALGTNVSWLDKVRERASVAEKRYNMWRKASHELDRYISDHSTTSLILDGGEGEGSKLKSREKEAKYELRQAEKVRKKKEKKVEKVKKSDKKSFQSCIKYREDIKNAYQFLRR